MTKRSDRSLGMHRRITRRDLLHGFGAAAAASFVPGQTFAEQVLAAEFAAYPPALTGLRGSHDGAYEVAHAMRDGASFGAPADVDSEYDLIVVGGGISGLSAAYFYRKQYDPNACILIIDNHDDFGGHARRNEFEVAGRTLRGHGGSQTLQEPAQYSDVMKGLLRDLGVETKRFEQAYVHDFFRKHGLVGGTYFDRETFGVDRVVRYPLMDYSHFLPLGVCAAEEKQ